MNVRELADRRALQYVLNLHYDRGYGYWEIMRALERRYPLSTPQSRDAIWSRALLAATRTRNWLATNPETPLQAKQLAKPDPGCTQWRYTMRVEIENPDTGLENRFYHAGQYATSQRRSTVETDATLVLSAMMADPNRVGESPPHDPASLISKITIVAVERACP